MAIKEPEQKETENRKQKERRKEPTTRAERRIHREQRRLLLEEQEKRKAEEKAKREYKEPPEKIRNGLPGQVVWREEFVMRIYQLSCEGFGKRKIAQALGKDWQGFLYWIKTRPVVMQAIEEGRRKREHKDGSITDFKRYVYGCLDIRSRKMWRKIISVEGKKNQTATEKLHALLESGGKYMRMNLWVHALISSNFNASEACKRIGVPYQIVMNWCKNDPHFKKLLQEIHWHKGNFFESKLVGLVESGDSAATIFANKTFNKSRGYGEKLEITGKVEHNHAIDLQETLKKLPLETRREMLRISRESRKDVPLLESPDDVIIDAESKEVLSKEMNRVNE